MKIQNFNNGKNTLILYTAKKIYKYKMKWRLTNSKSDRETLYNFVQSSLINILQKNRINIYKLRNFKKKMCIGL